MNCPACENQLTQKLVSGVTLDVCDNGCAGIWFDRFEMKKFDEEMEPDVETILHLKRNPARKLDVDAIRNCPKCTNMKMMRHFSSIKKEVLIDECPQCAGVWLDAGELTQIRHEFHTEGERIQAAENLFDQVFGKALAEERQKDMAQFSRAKRLSKAFSFICPSYYLKK